MKSPSPLPIDARLRRALSRRTLSWAAIASGLVARGLDEAVAQTAGASAFSYSEGFPG
ncbi:MAG: hypothetical protein R2853_18795 [Thermomicrobiales bacterium]